MKEQKADRLDLDGIDADVFLEILTYIYTSRAPNLETIADRLLTAANMVILTTLGVI